MPKLSRVGLGIVLAAFLAVTGLPATRGLGADRPRADQPVSPEMIQKMTAALPDRATVKPAQMRKLIVLTIAKTTRHATIPLAAKTIELMGAKTGAWDTLTTEDASVFTAEDLKPYDAIFLDMCSGDLFDDAAARTSLLEFVKGGKGIIGIHAATRAFPNWTEFNEMMGAVDVQGHTLGHISVKIDNPLHPLNAGFGNRGFEITDDVYQYKNPYSRDKLRVLLSIDWENSNLPKDKGTRSDNDYALGWIQTFGQGRVFYSAFGHSESTYYNPAILRHWMDGIQFALGDLKCDATPSAKLTAKPMPARGPVLPPSRGPPAPRQPGPGPRPPNRR